MNTPTPLSSSHATNNFDFLRVVAAALVIFSHCWGLFGRDERIFGVVNDVSWGSVAVAMFFIISGYLITASRLHSRSAKSYGIKRALRILPGLWGSVFFCMFILGPLVTTLPLADYFAQEKTWSFARNLIPWNIAYDLPGVFEKNPNHSANGVYWTLPIEIICYMGVALFAWLRLLRGHWTLLFAFTLLVLNQFTSMNAHVFLGRNIYFLTLYGGQFALGATFYLWRDKIPLRAEIFFTMLLMVCATAALPSGSMVLYAAMPYMVVYLAFSPLPFHRFSTYGDFSYGLYLYGLPVQQLLIMWRPGIPALVLFFTALPIALLFAIASWRLIEAPALALKRRRLSSS